MKNSKTPTAEREKIVVRAPNWIGDQILAYPFFYYLRKKYPEAWIIVICVSWVRSLQYLDCVDEVWTLPKFEAEGLWARFKGLNQTAKEWRKRGPFALGISLPNSFSSAWLLFQMGVQTRRGYKTEGRGFLLNAGLDWKKKGAEVHRAQAYLNLLPESDAESGGADVTVLPGTDFWTQLRYPELAEVVDTSQRPEPSLWEGELAALPFEDAWPNAELIDPSPESYFILAPGATARSRQWFPERWGAVAEKVHKATGWKPVLVGGPKELALAKELKARWDLPWIDKTAQVPVSGLWPLFTGAKLSLTNESGLAHFASVCGSPVFIVCGAADPRRTHPIGPGPVQVSFNPVECWPCEKNDCYQPREGQLACLRGLETENIKNQLFEFMKKYRIFG